MAKNNVKRGEKERSNYEDGKRLARMPQEAFESTEPYLRYPQKRQVAPGVARWLNLGLQLQEPFSLLTLQPSSPLGTPCLSSQG
jgi:hypothetical protein